MVPLAVLLADWRTALSQSIGDSTDLAPTRDDYGSVGRSIVPYRPPETAGHNRNKKDTTHNTQQKTTEAGCVQVV